MLHQATGVYLEVYDFRVENIVRSIGFGFHVNINLFYDDHQATSVFNPSVFVGLQYTPVEPRPVGILFDSGRAVLTGLSHPDEAIPFVQNLNIHKYEKGKEYRKMDPQSERKRDCDRPDKRKRPKLAVKLLNTT
jgi:TATA-box binding protein (TBP) (component of TFIID and TFIIIB)